MVDSNRIVVRHGSVAVKPWVKNVVFACAAACGLVLLAAVGVGGTFVVQQVSLEPEEARLVQQPPTAAAAPGRVVLSLSSAAVTVRAGPAGGSIRVESSFDPDVHGLEQSYDEDGSWIYRLDFHEKRLLHVAVASVWLGKRSPEVTIEIPRDLPLALEAKMEGGYLVLDLAGLEITAADIELDRGVLGLTVSEPLRVPMERLSVRGRIGTMFVRSLGNASPRVLRLRHGVGVAHVDLGGRWVRDADVDFQVVLGDGELTLPDDVHVVGRDGGPLGLVRAAGDGVPTPTLRVSTDSDVGEIRVIDQR
jgi:hypothetical protein